MQIKIKNNTLNIQIDSTAKLIDKIVSSKPSGKSVTQGAIYVNRQYINRFCLFILMDPICNDDMKHTFDFNGSIWEYYDMLIREIKSVKTSKIYETGRAYLPADWSGKRVIGIVLSP